MMKILYLQYANPAAFPPIEYSSRILAERGWAVRFLGVHSQGSENMKFPGDSGIAIEVMPYVAPGWRQKLAYLKFIVRSLIVARNWKPDWVYVSDLMAAPVGLLLSRLLGFKVIYHEHDSPIPRHNASKFIRMLMRTRASLAKRAEFNVLPQDERILLFKKATGTHRPVLRVWNCPLRQEAMGEVIRERQSAEPLSVYFHGSLNLDRVPLALIAGAAKSGVPVRLRIVGYETIGSQGTSEILRQAAADAGDHVTLELPGAMSRHELPAQMAGMHVGWINFINRSNDINLTHLEGASNKAFDYLAAGLPLIVAPTRGWEEIYVVPGYAKTCDPACSDSIAETLRWFHDNPSEAARMGRAGQQRTRDEWNYEKQFAPILERIHEA